MSVKLCAAAVVAFLTTGALVVSAQRPPTAAGPAFPPIAVVALPVPTDIPGTAPSASLQQAAAFAWQEFIALNWPAVPQTAAANTRDTPDTTCRFDDPKCATRQRVWESFRSKLEIFPGNGQPPNGYSKTAPDFGYDAAPAYNYSFLAGSVPACTAPPVQPSTVPTAWINLDESDQITVDSMFAGAGPTVFPGNSDPQMIRFLAKANRTEYDYVAQNGWWGAIPLPVKSATIAYLGQNLADPTPAPAGTASSTVSLPYNTIEVKAGWRVLTPAELTSGRFHTATARYYEFITGQRVTCWRQATFGLVALHIIQKTPSAPYFIYASFEQADNIRTPGNKPVENDDGSIAVPPACPAGQASPCPTSPLELLVDAPTPAPNSAAPPRIVLQPQPASPRYCTPSLRVRPKYQLYYLDEPGTAAGAPFQPSHGFICVNARMNPIPREIIAVNAAAQSAIRAYERANGFATPSPLTHYKLVNVQYVPYDNPRPGPFGGHDAMTGNNPASFYLANIVVETNRSLQRFNGGLINNLVQAQYAGRFAMPPAVLAGSPTHKNTLFGHSGYNMGGCMGCHGSQGQSQGGNFSVILARGGNGNLFPEPPGPVAPSGPMQIKRNRRIVNY